MAAILADLQAIIGIRPWKHEISLKIDFDGSNDYPVKKNSVKKLLVKKLRGKKLLE